MGREREDWLARYANNYHAWKRTTIDGKNVYTRPMGLIEYSFDIDGTDFGGRADMNSLFTLEIKHILSKEDFRRRIACAWASLRLQHTLLQARIHEDAKTGRRNFVVELQDSVDEVLKETLKSIVWVEDSYASVNAHELHRHCLNVARIIDPSQCLSRLHVLPLVKLPNGNFQLQFLIIMAHQIGDGLSMYNWFSHFLRILNMPTSEVERAMEKCRHPEIIASRLPPAQEDLYPPISGSKARQRWFWTIMRVLRHVRKTSPQTFVNPLRRDQRLSEAVTLEPKFPKLFDYSPANKPPMNSFHCTATLSKDASTRLIALCKSIKVSVGAGCFALAGISMMEMYESRYPDTPTSLRLPFAASFPLNPRAFVGLDTPPDSCMLAFSDGILMPFLPSSLPIEARFRLTAKHANRELRVYQKRLKNADAKAGLDPHSPGRIIANNYLWSTERIESRLPAERKMNINPQGSLPATISSGATCGVSSIGLTSSWFREGMYDLNEKGKDFVADYRGLKMGVRARDHEFLIGSSTDWNGIIGFGVSYDGNAISEEAAEAWARKVRSLLEVEGTRLKL